MTTISTDPLDVMSIERERRLTRPLAIEIDHGHEDKNLNDDYLRVTSIQGQESVSQPYQFTVEISANDNIPVKDGVINYGKNFQHTNEQPLAQGLGGGLLGKWTKLRVAMPYNKDRFSHKPTNATPEWENKTPSRFFSGIISSVTHSSPGTYQLAIQSPLYPLTLRNRYTVHKEQTIKELLSTLLTNETLIYNAHFKVALKLEGSAINRRQDWLQAGESDFDFMQRMMKKACIHFYFIHGENELTLVFSNKTTHLQEVDIPNCDNMPLKLRYSYTDIKTLGLQQSDLFCDLKYEVKMVQQSVETVLTRQQAVWETNQVAKYTSYQSEKTAVPAQYKRYNSFAYGVDGDEVSALEKKLKQQLATDEGTLSGTSTSPLLSPGYTFMLEQPVKTAALSTGRMPTQFNGRTFVVTKITHKVSDTSPYSGSVEATEVNENGDDTKDTLITPFNMQATHQGSVLAKVLKTSVPSDWRFRNKSNFHTEISSVNYDARDGKDKTRQIGCLVQFATDSGPNDDCCHWVALSATSQTAPEVDALVVIGRGSNESEIPEIQQVLSSNGSKVIQPLYDGASWTANTNWGSHYSVNYGSSVNLSQADFSMGHSETGKSVNVSVTGKGDGLVAPKADYQTIKAISDSLNVGDSYNQNHTKGKSVNLSGTGIAPPHFLDTAGLTSYSNSMTAGGVVNNSVTLGGVTSNNVTVGATNNITTNTGAVSNISTTQGLSSNVDVFLGAKSDVNTFIGAHSTISTFNGVKSEINIHNNIRTVEGTHTAPYNVNETNLMGKVKTVITDGMLTFSELTNGNKTAVITVDGVDMLNEITTGDKTHTMTNAGASTFVETTAGEKTNTITNNGAITYTETNNGVITKSSTNNGAVTVTETNDGTNTRTITNNGASTLTATTTGANNVNITNSGEVSYNETNTGVASIKKEYVGVASLSTTFGGPGSISYTGSPCVVSDERVLVETKAMVTQTVDMLTIM